jgi:hypothetical protein
LSITGSASGSGNGTVHYSATANAGPERTGTITAGGQTFTVTQAGGCVTTISPSSQSLPAAGGSGSFSVNAGSGCAWTAAAKAPWITLTSGESGTGGGTVQFTVAPNSSAARIGTITAAGQTFTVNQESGCSAVVAPDTIVEPAAGGAQSVAVTTAPDCSWTAASNALPWLAVTAGAGGTGNGNVQLEIQPNTGPARNGTATIAGRTVTVNQDSGCVVTIDPASHAAPAAGGPGSVTITTTAGCTWTAVSNAPAWIHLTSPETGSGSGSVAFTVDGTTAARSGTITISGQVFTVNQAGM